MMDQKYLAEIKARCESDLPDVAAPVFRDRKALLAEVERLNKMLADSFQGQLLNELAAKDQQIAALKRALLLMGNDLADWMGNGTGEFWVRDYTHQAQEQEEK